MSSGGRGRGRGVSNAPAWMTRQQQQQDDMSDKRKSRSRSRERRRDSPPPRDHPPYYGGDPYFRGRPPAPYGGPPRRDVAAPPYHPRRGPAPVARGNRSGIYFNSLAEERAWVEERRRKRRERKSLFDVEPTAEQRALEEAQKVVTAAGTTSACFRTVETTPTSASDYALPQQTRHARRLYVGHLPVELTEDEVHVFFRDAIRKAMGQEEGEGREDPILSVYINKERRFAFVEFKSMELCTACIALDGINVCGKGKVKIKRPNDYNAAAAPHSVGVPQFDVSRLGIVSATVPDGPNKIFVGGLPYHLTDEQVMELLAAFGRIKAFHLVKNDPTASKGYCFVEYADPSVTPVAVAGLNGMDMGAGKVLSARIAAFGVSVPGLGTVAPILPPQVVNGVDVQALLDAAMGAAATNPMSAPSVQSAYQAATQYAPSSATRILVLLNMVTDEDLATDDDYQGLCEEVKEECQKFGKLLTMKIPRHQDGYDPSAVKKVFLEYASADDAMNAERELAGRSFGSSVVVTSFFNESEYAAGRLF